MMSQKNKSLYPITKMAKLETVQNESLSAPNPVVNPKKRGRPRKSIEIPNQAEKIEVNTPNTSKPKNDHISYADLGENTELLINTKSTKTSKSRCKSNIDDFNPRLLLIKSREQLCNDEVLTVHKNDWGTGELQCGLCLKRTTKNNWEQHLADHYGIGWIVGSEEPLDITTRKTVLAKTSAFMKNSKIPALLCRLCQRSFRSSLGLIQHLESCGEAPQRIECTNCGNSYTKLSLAVHQRGCNGDRLQPTGEDTPKRAVEDKSETKNSHGRIERVSSAKAKRKLKTQIENLQSESSFIPEQFVKSLVNELDSKIIFACRICGEKTNFKSKFEAIQHVSNQHKTSAGTNNLDATFLPDPCTSDADSDFNGGDDHADDDAIKHERTIGLSSSESGIECATSTSRKGKNVSLASNNKAQAQLQKIYASRCSDVSALTHKMWQNFVDENYNQNSKIFKNSVPLPVVLSNETFEKLLPSESSSMKFNCKQKLESFTKFNATNTTIDLEWQTLQRFEEATSANDLDKYIYVGAPIKFLQWIPLPPEIQEQYLVVSYRKSSNTSAHACLLNPKVQKTLLLVYKLDLKLQAPKLHYALFIADGPVHTFAFLPSGGYDAETNRLCLIAVGGVKSKIRVYAMPIEPPTTTQNTWKIPIIKLPIAFELVLNSYKNDEVEAQCLQICWSDFLGHEHVFASFSNGAIAIWRIYELKTGVGILNTLYYEELETGKRCYIPRNYFFPEGGRPNGLEVHYDTCGPRWLLTISVSRNLCVFDIRDICHPVIVMSEHLKHFPRCIDWSPVWETFSVGTCDTVPNYGRVLTIYNHLGVTYSHMSLAHSLSGIASAHYNPWENLVIFATDNGDLCCVESTELNLDLKNAKRSVVLSMLDVKRLNDVDSVDLKPVVNTVAFPIIHKTSLEQEKYFGIVFGTFFQLKGNDLKLIRNEKRKPSPHIERHIRINIARWNLNAKGKHLLAVGYENGFLRCSSFHKEVYFK